MGLSQAYFQLLKLTNITTDLPILRHDEEVRIEAVEYYEEGVSFECGERSCAKGQLVKVEGMIHLPNQEMQFEGVGKILDTKKIGNSRLQVKLEFHQYNRDIWHDFVSQLQARQNKVDKLFNSMRDEE